MSPPADHDQACAVGLVDLPGMTPVRLARLLDGFGPALAWWAVAAGTHPADPARRFLSAARVVDPAETARRYGAAGVEVLLPGRSGYPAALVGDPGAPAVLCASGDPSVLEARPAVAVVGTRSATRYGTRVASDLGRGLAEAGDVVVSGLALGIDAAAHSGALAARPGSAPPVAVVGTGLDVIYPREHRPLWERVASEGVVLSEAALGTPPRPRVFPARNRIIAALSDIVVVVECHGRGGSLHTVEAAARRSIPVCAVPGAVHSPASRGTNGLLVDGCIPVRDVDDVLTALSLATGGTSHLGAHRAVGDPTEGGPSTDDLGRVERAVWEAVDEAPTLVETVLLRTNLSLGALTEVGDRLAARGLLVAGAGWWTRA